MPRTVAGPRMVVPYNLGKCINFNQSTNRVTFTVPNSMESTNLPNFTVAVWFYQRSFSNINRVFEPNSNGNGFAIIYDTAVGLRGSVAHATQLGIADMPIGSLRTHTWYRYVMTWSDANNSPDVYLNGALFPTTKTNKVGARGTTWTGATAYLGNRSSLDRQFDGLMDEFCVWNRVLTTEEISNDYYRNIIPSSGLILRYMMDETSGSLTDASGNSITGTPTNVTQNVTSINLARSAATGRTLI